MFNNIIFPDEEVNCFWASTYMFMSAPKIKFMTNLIQYHDLIIVSLLCLVQGNHILATLWKNQKAAFLDLFYEKRVHTISNIKVKPEPSLYRSVDRVSINFCYKTIIKKVSDTRIIPKYKFELKKFEDVHDYVGNIKSFIGEYNVHLLMLTTLSRTKKCYFNFYRSAWHGDKLWAFGDKYKWFPQNGCYYQ